MSILILYLIIHLICAAVSTSILIAEFGKSYAQSRFGEFWLISLVLGPVGTVVYYFCSNFAQHGFANPFKKP